MQPVDSVDRMSADPEPTKTRRPLLRTSLVALGERNFRLFWVGGVISNTGRFFQAVALPIIVFQITGSAGWVGISGFALLLPTAMMAPLAGAIADRYPRRRVLLITQLLQAVVALGFMLMWYAGVRSVGAYVGVSVLAGAAGGLNLPAWQAFVSELVPRDQLMSAITLNSAQFNAARMIGPALAGVMISAVGPGWAFGVNAISYAAVLIALAMMRLEPRVIEVSTPMRPLREFVETLRYVSKKPGIVTAIGTVGLIGFFGASVQMMSVVMAEEVFDRGGRGFGLMLSSVGLGAVLIAPVVTVMAGRHRRSRIQGLALVFYGLAIVILALSPWFGLALLAMMLMGAAHITSASTLNTAIQLQVDERIRAKVLSVYLMVLLGANPLGQLGLGQFIERFGPRQAIGASGLLLLVASLVLGSTGRLDALDINLGAGDPLGDRQQNQ